MAAASVEMPSDGGGVRWFRHQLAVGERPGDGIRRVCLGELDRALDALGDSDRVIGVHTARKAIKRTRAALRLVRDRIGPDVFDREDTVLGGAGRALTELRTAHVMVTTAGEVGASDGDLARRLEARAGDLEREIVDERGALDDVAVEIVAARARLAALAPDDGEGAGGLEAAMAAALVRSHARGSRGMAKAAKRRTTEAFHRWRRRVRYLRYQTEMLHAVWPHPIGELADDLAVLAELLGVEHDLAELEVLVAAEPRLMPEPAVRAGFLTAVAEGRQTRQMGALELGSRIYADATRELFDQSAAVGGIAEG